MNLAGRRGVRIGGHVSPAGGHRTAERITRPAARLISTREPHAGLGSARWRRDAAIAGGVAVAAGAGGALFGVMRRAIEGGTAPGSGVLLDAIVGGSVLLLASSLWFVRRRTHTRAGNDDANRSDRARLEDAHVTKNVTAPDAMPRASARTPNGHTNGHAAAPNANHACGDGGIGETLNGVGGGARVRAAIDGSGVRSAPAETDSSDRASPGNDLSVSGDDLSPHEQAAAVGRELHDIVGQQLTGVSLLLGAVQQRLDASGAGNEQTSDLLHTARQQLDEAFDAARALSRRLDGFATPSRAIEDADRLIESGAPCGRVVRAMVADADRRFGVGVRVRAEIGVDLDALRGPWVSEIVSIAREAVTNAVRHGRATRVHVLLFTDGARGVLDIVDDGRGISLSLSRFAMDGTRVHARATGDDARDSPAAADHDDATSGITHDRSAAGLGLKMMRDRAEGLGGVLTLGTWRDERGGLRGERGGFVRLTWPLHDSARYGDDSGDFRGILSSSPRASAEESRDQA